MVKTGTLVHRALADERRARIVAELGASRAGLDVRELGKRLGLHPNTIRFHLGVLRDAGLVESRSDGRGVAGRPRILYSVSAEAAHDGAEEHRLLATILTGTVAGLADGAERASEAGRAWGHYLVKRPLPLTRRGEEEATAEVAALLDQQGFEPEVAEREIRMRRCPFHDLAEAHPDVICAVHRGLIDGALDELGSGLELGELDVFPEPDLCVARLSPVARGR